MNCMNCKARLKIKVVIPEESSLLVGGSTKPKDNAYCSACGMHVPVSHARLLLNGNAVG